MIDIQQARQELHDARLKEGRMADWARKWGLIADRGPGGAGAARHDGPGVRTVEGEVVAGGESAKEGPRRCHLR